MSTELQAVAAAVIVAAAVAFLVWKFALQGMRRRRRPDVTVAGLVKKTRSRAARGDKR